MELLKAGLDSKVDILYVLINKLGTEEKVSKEWTQGVNIKIPMKGDLTNWSVSYKCN